jgi:hypothetical protein
MRFNHLILIALLGAACTQLPFPQFGQRSQTRSSSSTEELTVNGKPVPIDDEGEERPRSKKPQKAKAQSDIGKTCRKNDECTAAACFVGNGNLGYCTKMCNSWSDCPSGWECKRAANAPQRICMQDDW